MGNEGQGVSIVERAGVLFIANTIKIDPQEFPSSVSRSSFFICKLSRLNEIKLLSMFVITSITVPPYTSMTTVPVS
jgi:hypothetical protein